MFEEPIDNPHRPSGREESARARNAALRLLALRPRTAAEMRERLRRRFSDTAAEQTVSKLQAEGLLNDKDFARQWRESRERRKPRSPGMIAQELKQRGVAAEIISQALEGFDSYAAAYRSAIRYASRQSSSDRAAFGRRVGSYLERRGFNPGVIRRTVEQLQGELGVSDINTDEPDRTTISL